MEKRGKEDKEEEEGGGHTQCSQEQSGSPVSPRLSVRPSLAL